MREGKLVVAVVGCGAVSRNHGKAIASSKAAVLKYAVDIDLEKAKAFSGTYGGEPTDDYEKVLRDSEVDVVHVVTPHFTHPELAIRAMEAGKDVFCEKPLAIHVSDAKRMIRVSEKTGRKLNVCFQNRLNDSSIEAKRLIEEGTYGKVLSAAALVRWDRGGTYYTESPWRGRYETEGGSCIINQSIHTLDLLQYLCGRVTALSAVDAHLRDTKDYETEDSVMANFRFENGATAVGAFTNCATGFKTARVEIVLEQARLTVEQGGLAIDLPDGRKIVHASAVAHGAKSEWGLSHGKMIEAFYASILRGTPVPVDGRAALEAVKIVNAIQYSKGREVLLEK